MRPASTLLVLASLLLAGCLGDNEPLEQENVDQDGLDVTGDAEPLDEQPRAGICVIGVESPCNGPEWEDPCVAPGGRDPTSMKQAAQVSWSGPDVIEPGTDVDLRVAFPNHIAAKVVNVTWTFRDTPLHLNAAADDWTFANGTDATHAWRASGSYLVKVEATDGCGDAIAARTVVLGVSLNATWENTIVAGDGGACVAPPHTCGNHSVTLPPAATSLKITLERPDAPAGDGLVVTATGPDGAAGTGTSLLIDAPTFGNWTLKVHGQDAATAYTLRATASFPDDRGTLTRY